MKEGLPDFIVTAAISPNKKIIDEGYDIPKISRYLDYINIMAYDYHGLWDSKIFPNAPLYSNDDASVVSNNLLRYYFRKIYQHSNKDLFRLTTWR